MKDSKEAEILPFIKDYLMRFEYKYWINLVKIYVEKIKLYLINFMKLYNNLLYFMRYFNLNENIN